MQERNIRLRRACRWSFLALAALLLAGRGAVPGAPPSAATRLPMAGWISAAPSTCGPCSPTAAAPPSRWWKARATPDSASSPSRTTDTWTPSRSRATDGVLLSSAPRSRRRQARGSSSNLGRRASASGDALDALAASGSSGATRSRLTPTAIGRTCASRAGACLAPGASISSTATANGMPPARPGSLAPRCSCPRLPILPAHDAGAAEAALRELGPTAPGAGCAWACGG